jgi:hypothetical protein
MAMQVPSFAGNRRKLVVRHREYIGDVISSSTSNAFSLTSYTINPGSVQTFPWLSKISQNFDHWKPLGVVFAFKSTSAAFNGTTQALGSVIMATDYDVLDSSYASKVEMENSEFAVSCSSDCSMLHPVECADDEMPLKRLYTRSGMTLPSGANAQLYDLGNFQIATVGIAGTSVNLGELWVTYEIEFTKEQVTPNAGILFSRSTATSSLGTYFYTAAPTADSASTFTPTFTTDTITFPSYLTNQHFWLVIVHTGASTGSLAAPTIAYTSNCVAGSAVYGTGTNFFATASTTDTTVVTMCSVRLTGPNAVMTWSSGTLPGTLSRIEVTICQRPL